jgi:hypothetical protein
VTTDKTSTKRVGSKTTARDASGYAHKVAGQSSQGDEKVPADKNEPLRQTLTFFMLELQLGIRTINKMNEVAYAEFDRITPDEVALKNTNEASELLEMNAFLELLAGELQRLAQKAQIIVGRFRNSLLDVGVDAAALEERTNKKSQDWPSDEAERLKEIMAKHSKKEMAISTQIMITLPALFKLHEILESVGHDYGPFDRVDMLALLLTREIMTIMKNLDGGELWKVLSAQAPK